MESATTHTGDNMIRMIRTDWVDSMKDCMNNCNVGERYYIMHAAGYGSVYQKEHYGYSHTAIENEDCLNDLPRLAGREG